MRIVKPETRIKSLDRKIVRTLDKIAALKGDLRDLREARRSARLSKPCPVT